LCFTWDDILVIGAMLPELMTNRQARRGGAHRPGSRPLGRAAPIAATISTPTTTAMVSVVEPSSAESHRDLPSAEDSCLKYSRAQPGVFPP
jgi:hypothetical protein